VVAPPPGPRYTSPMNDAPPAHHPTVTFKAYRRFNDPALWPLTRLRHRLGPRALPYFDSDGLPDRFARALADRQAIDLKELFESAEMFERVRRRLRAPHVADLCCGHGLTGVLFAMYERRVERVTLIDQRRPGSFDAVLEAAVSVAPWVADKVEYREIPLARAGEAIGPGTSVVAVHACGVRTDRCLEAGIATGGPIAVMPCCYAQTAGRAPPALRRALGRILATDVDRTYRLTAAGFQVGWSVIPHPITPMNRILVARRPPG